jgi:aspartate/methionine/tyrosine aminotransferase
MEYQEYRLLRDRIVAESNPLRLDCMNPAKALAGLAPPNCMGTARPDEALAAWRQTLVPDFDPRSLIATTGVRPALSRIFADLAADKYELWLPVDVYPEYWRSAQSSGLAAHGFATLPRPEWTRLENASDSAALLLPHPLTPLGRYVTADEIAFLKDWLGHCPKRRLILDTAYHFDDRLDATARDLVAAGQTFLVHSLAKAWLLPDTLGVIVWPEAHARAGQRTEAEGATTAFARAVHALTVAPDLPRQLAATFKRQWQAVSEQIQAAEPHWQPPATGYFSVVEVPFETLLQKHGILSAPASVFGSSREDLSIVSCLYYPA